MNILILSIGAKHKIVTLFKQNDFYVVTTDCSELSAGLYASDKYYIVPRMNEKNYIPTLLGICEKEKIDVILPLQEDELVLISENRNIFLDKGIFIASSESSVIELCKDKYSLCQYLTEREVNIIPAYDAIEDKEAISNLDFPVFIKPRFGAGSIGTLKANTKELLYAYLKDSNTPMIVQPFFEAEEYGVDAYIDFLSGNLTSIFIKKKLRMRAGETEKSISVYDENIIKLVQKVTNSIEFRGPIDLDIFKIGNKYYILEINPRFGGGYPHAYHCGINFPLFIKNNAMGQTNVPKLQNYDSNVIALKYTETYSFSEA